MLQGVGEMALLAKALAIKPNFLSLIPGPTGERREGVPKCYPGSTWHTVA